ncbi:MAG: amidohydrolase family protein [Actinomycetota bacterium]|nr:amidohydrolase family protein [Actinomycetota bacterium]
MAGYEVEKEYWDGTDDIEAVNIHYTWTPLGEAPDWDREGHTRFMPPSRETGAGRRHRTRVLVLPERVMDARTGTLSDHFELHHYFEIFEHGARRYSERFREEVVTGAGAHPAPPAKGAATTKPAKGAAITKAAKAPARRRRRTAPVGYDIGAAGPGPPVGTLGHLSWFDEDAPRATGRRRVAYRGRLRGDGLALRYGFDGWKEPALDAALEEVEPGLAVTGPLDVAGHLALDCCVTDGRRWDNNFDVDYRLWTGFDPVDSHLHVSGTGSGAFGRASLEVAMASAGMTAGVVSWFDNRATAAVGRSGKPLYPLVWVNPGVTPEEELVDCLAHGFVGIKLHPTLDGFRADDRALDPYLAIAAEAGCPVACHSAPGDADPDHIRRLAERHPTVPVILYHTYLGPPEGRRRAVRHVLKVPNLYLETSWCRWKTVVRFVEAVGPERVLFGSDASVDGHHHYRREPPNVEARETYNDGLLALVAALGPEASRLVMCDNTRRCFALDQPRSGAGQDSVT